MENEDLAKLYFDRDEAEQEAEEINEEMRQFEMTHDNFEELDEWSDLHDVYYEVSNRATYYTSCIESIEDRYE